MNKFNYIAKVIRNRLKKFTVSFKYNDFTIAEYFRSQGAQIGTGCFFGIRNLGTEPFLMKIGNNVAVAAGVKFHNHDGGTWIFREEYPDLRVFGPIIIEDNCIIGSNAQIMPNVTIGKNSIVSPGSLVINDIPEDSIVMGIPARRLGSVKKYKENCLEKWNEQKPENFDIGKVRQYGIGDNPNAIMEKLKPHLIEIFSDKLKS